MPIVLKWVLIGRWRFQEFPIWGVLRSVQFWILKTAIRSNPVAVFFAGSPLYLLHLRALHPPRSTSTSSTARLSSRSLASAGSPCGPRPVDDGCFLSERGFVSVGDDCALNAGSVLQCHSQEDGAFKSDRTQLGSRCTVGIGSLVHYGVTMGDDVELAPDSFVMKGEEVPAGAHWAGNPARPVDDRVPGRV